jgi:hypothetical protein
MGPQASARLRTDNARWLSENKIGGVDMNMIYAVGDKPS